MTVDTWFEEQFRDKYQEHAEKLGQFNLAIFGKTGVGKSTLINAVFGEDLAVTGIGKPVTMDSHLYLSSAGFLGLYDTRGVEIGDDTETIIGELEALIRENREKPISEQIHAAWYCVSALSGRIEETEAEFIRRLDALELPVIVVLTKVSATDGVPDPEVETLADEIVKLELPIEGRAPVLVMAKEHHRWGDTHGLQALLDATFRVVPEGVEGAFTAAQKIDLSRKRKRAMAAVAAAAGLAGGVGATPIPIADATVLVPIQMGMIASVSVIYGIKVDKATLVATLVPSIATNAGRAAVTGLLKLVPGAGTIVGGLISGGTAVALTAAMGYAWVAVCDQLLQGKLHSDDGLLDKALLRELFNDEFLAQITKLLPAAKTAAT